MHLTFRDDAMLRALARFRIARTSDLGRLFFPGRHRDVLAQRLRRLYDAGYLELAVRELAAENTYWVGPKGRERLRAAGLEVVSVPRGGWDHHLAIVKAWSFIAAEGHRENGQLRLAKFVPEWDVRRDSAAGSPTVVPDALIDISLRVPVGAATLHVALEVDLGSEWLPALRRKLEAYEALRRAALRPWGWKSFGLLLVLDGPGRRRQAQVRDLVRSVWGGPAAVWDVHEAIEAAFRSLLGPAAASRFGNGREASASALLSAAPLVAGGRPSEDMKR